MPILMRGDKTLDECKTKIRIQFKQVPRGLFPVILGTDSNELVICVQPDEEKYAKSVSNDAGGATCKATTHRVPSCRGTTRQGRRSRASTTLV